MVTSDLLTPYGNVALRKQGTQRKGYRVNYPRLKPGACNCSD